MIGALNSAAEIVSPLNAAPSELKEEQAFYAQLPLWLWWLEKRVVQIDLYAQLLRLIT
jgi:hypothetical protein